MNRLTLAKLISRIFDFPLWSPTLLILSLFNSGLTYSQIQILFPLLLVINVILPIGIFLYFLKTKLISDVDVTKRRQRYLLFGIGTVIFLSSAILTYFLGNREFFVLSLTSFILVLTIFLITLKWKISGHMLMNTYVIFIINYLFDWKYLGLFVILPFVAFARIYLKKHDILQVIGGTVVGILVPYLILKFFGFI